MVARDAAGRRLGLFYGLATLIAWCGWIPYAADQVWKLGWSIPVELPILAQYSPTLSALLLVSLDGGPQGLGQFLATSLNWRFGLRWYVIAMFTAPAMGLVAVALSWLVGSPPPVDAIADWPARVAAFMRTSDGAVPASSPIASLAAWAASGPLQAALTFLGLAIANGGLSEEAGWRGYAFQGLRSGRRAIAAALWVGLLWGLWHTGPGFWIGLFEGKWAVVAGPIEYCLVTTPLAVMIGWVFVGAKRSLLPCILFHASYNATFTSLTVLGEPGHPLVSSLEWVGLTLTAAALVCLVGRSTLFARPPA
jgi:uncharacterized protein